MKRNRRQVAQYIAATTEHYLRKRADKPRTMSKAEFREAVIKMAIQALEKEIPKKPKIMDSTLVGEKFWWYCGHCGASRHTNSKSNCCSYCGGKVNWNEAES